MRRKMTALMLVLVMSLGLGSWTSFIAAAAETEKTADEEEKSADRQTGAADATAGNEEKDVDEQVREILSRMSVEQKLAQMMIVAFRSGSKSAAELTAPYKEILKKYDFGGVIFFGDNIVDAGQTVTMIRGCQEAAAGSEQGIPMLICVDQEGGIVNRVSFGTTSSGSMALAATGDEALTEESADMMGQEIRALGFNMDFAPVSDVNSNPNNPVIGVRSFSDDPQIAAGHVKAFIRGLDKNGVLAALKHFPGHGNVGEDSHTHLPSSDHSLEELRACDLIPFQAGIDAGADMIMSAHIQHPKIETGKYTSKLDGKDIFLPATLSRTIITGILREEIGYDGIVITDAMDMDAIASHFDRTDAAVLAINADVDILLCPVNVYQDGEEDTFPDVDKYMKDLLARVEAGDISEEELDNSVSRILKLKIKKGIMESKPSESVDEQIEKAKAVVGSPEHHKREWEIMQKGLTLVKNEGGMLPLDGKDGKRTLILVPSDYRMPTVEYAVGRLEKEGLADASAIDILCYSEMQKEDKKLQEALNKADRVLVLSQSSEKNDVADLAVEQIRQKEGGRAALISLNLPYDAAFYEDADAVLCAYNPYGDAHDEEGNGPFNLNVAAALCTAFGQSVPQGRLPVNLPKAKKNESGELVFSDEILIERGFGLLNWGVQ